MNWLEELVGKTILKKVLRRIEDMKILDGYKTYIISAAGIIVVLIGLFFGQTDIGPISIPAMDFNTSVKYLWAALMAIFMRAGIKKVG